MVKYASILSANSSFFSTRAPKDLTAVFVGATSGIGLGALRAFAKHTSGASPTIFIVGRSQKTLNNLLGSVTELNSSAKLVPIYAPDLTLISDAQKAAEEIAQKASKIDMLIMSPGYVSFQRVESPEGLDRVQAIRYYSRMRFLLTLRPLLLKAPAPRVINVLGAGTEGELWPEDWTLKEHYSIGNAAGAAGSMTTLFFEEFAKQQGNEKIAIGYTFPGIVGGTGLTLEGLPWWLSPILGWVISPLMKLFGYSIEEAGERALFAGTSEQFVSKSQGGEAAAKGSDGTVGSSVYLVHSDSSVIPGNKALTGLREKKLGKQVWEHTLEVFEKVERS
ncbi:NAD(P)-binding protein [Lophiostoma macrostomum CBS 122681]|uniref:NAD(P)-binding protein n=1 Tax=Lophiostoma macrostomum CBS 122681 TaxID=1314788 RepID=A0A6A6SXF2_9PLEO|nr:NAD(P)-binding protein [Lophiostoma macrostomum CBS 122681]